MDSCDSAMTAVHKTINPLTLYTDSDLHVALPWPELGRARRLPLTISDCYTHGPTADRLHAVTRFNDANLTVTTVDCVIGYLEHAALAIFHIQY